MTNGNGERRFERRPESAGQRLPQTSIVMGGNS